MKVVILAGGLGTRFAEETEVRPKPMIEIGGFPIIRHIMKQYSHYGFNEFFLALGYKGEIIKRYFLDYYHLSGDITINTSNGRLEAHENPQCDDWLVHMFETGERSMTGGRIKRLEPYLKDETFMVTYGDGVSDVDVSKLLAFHRSHGKIATITAVHPPARYGEVVFDDEVSARFSEKPQTGEGWINGGFMVFEPAMFDYLKDDATILESDALEHMAQDRQLAAYTHTGFWQCMDTLREKKFLESLWQNGTAPWKTWND
jgi:glucose-1-phosphate cytidylyltransferase